MIKRNLTRRLEELEARVGSAEPLRIQIVYVSPDGSEEPDGPPFEADTSRDLNRPWVRDTGPRRWTQ